MTYVLMVIAVVALLERLWKQWMVVRFFRKPPPPPGREPRLLSILQPVVSGDPLLLDCLEASLKVPCRYPLEFLYLVDQTDPQGEALCRELIARHPERPARVLLFPPPPDRVSPKMFKLIEAMPQATGDVLCVLDDDTALTPGGLETCVPYLDQPGVGLAFGLPYYVSFGNFWSRIVACFVNSNSLLTYVPYTFLIDPITINGMFYVMRRDVYDATGGFAPLAPVLADDFAVARHFRQHGYRLAQTPFRHPIQTHVASPRAYFRLLHRWLIFPRETLLRGLTWGELTLVHSLALLSTLAPLLLLIGLAIWPSLPLALLTGGYLTGIYASFAHFNSVYLNRATPWRHSWLVLVLAVLLPLQVLGALLSPQRVNWRGNIVQIEPGGHFRYLRRREE